MKRGRLELISEFLDEVQRNPKLAPSRISARAGCIYAFADEFVESNMVEVEVTVEKRGSRHPILTEKGKLALGCYRSYIKVVGDFLS